VTHNPYRIFFVHSEFRVEGYPSVSGIVVYYQSILAFSSPLEPHISGMKLTVLKKGVPEFEHDFDESTKHDEVFTSTEGRQYQKIPLSDKL